MTKRVSTILSLALACALPLAVIAEPQGPKRGGDRPNTGGPGGTARPDREGWDKSRAQAEEFYKTHMPNRWKEFERIRENNKTAPESRRQMIMGMVTKYQGLQLQKDDKELFPIRVKQIETEDAEFGLVVDLSKTDKADTQKIDKLTTDLRTNAKQSVALRLEEQGIRLKRLTVFVEKQKAALDTDTKNEDRLIDERVKLMIDEGTEFFNPKHTRRGEGASTSPTTHSTSDAK